MLIKCIIVTAILVMVHPSLATEMPRSTAPVPTTQGMFVGSIRTTNGQLFSEFLGINYVAPPVGNLRWQKPHIPRFHNGIANATEFGGICPQFVKFDAVEDCLTMNIYVPRAITERVRTSDLPVMVFVHGGAYQLGNGHKYLGYDLSTYGDVIVVNFNYRIGPLGFLSTGDTGSIGNYGLWDQVAALKWVKNNIAAFGGDDNQVTVFGQSAGACSVSHLSMSPHAQGLFQRIILLSGSGSTYFGITDRHLDMSRLLGTSMLCLQRGTSRMVECLRRRKANLLTQMAMVVPSIRYLHWPSWLPVIDGDIIKNDPILSQENGKNANYDIIMGYAADDGAFLVFHEILNRPVSLAQYKWSTRLSLFILFNTYGNVDELVEMVYERFPELDSDDSDVRARALMMVATDFLFAASVYREADTHSRTSAAMSGGSTYFYEFQQRPDFKHPLHPSYVRGEHTDDVRLLFGEDAYLTCNPDDGIPFSEVDHAVSRSLQAYYSNFAHTGNPNEGPNKVDETWNKYTPTGQETLLQLYNMTMSNLSADALQRYSFWNKEFATITKPRSLDTEYRLPVDEDSEWFVEQLLSLEGDETEILGQLAYLMVMKARQDEMTAIKSKILHH